MLLSFDRRFLFVANTKTASTSIEVVLRPHAQIVRAETPARKHVPLSMALSEYKGAFAEAGCPPGRLLKFGVMRDPLDWIGSWFRYRKGNQVEAPLPPDMSFAEFWARADWNIRRKGGERHLQRRMFCREGKVLADLVIPFAQVDTMFPRICRGLGIPNDTLPRENASRLREIEGMTPALEAEMRDFYAEDYALLARLDEINAPTLARLDAGDYLSDAGRSATSK